MKHIDIWTDGACSGNPGAGGWAAILRYGSSQKNIAGGSPETTNNQMELQAVVSALSTLKEPCEVFLYSDSAYVVNAFTQNWIENWMTNNWRTAKKQPVANKELWLELIKLTKTHNVKFCKVAGHSTNLYNNLCDELARQQINNFRK